jgi:hypothetical protein
MLTKVRTSQQVSVAVAKEAQAFVPPFSVEVESSVFKRLTELSSKEGVPIKTLASEMLKAFLTLHHRELKQLIEKLKKRTRR